MVKVCQNCGKEIQDNRNYETHVLRCVFNRIKSLECDNCGKCYSYRSSLYLHQKTCIPGFGDKTAAGSHNEDASGSNAPKTKTRKKRPRNNTKTILVHNVVLKGESSLEKAAPPVRKIVNEETPSRKRHRYEMCLVTKTLKLIESDTEQEDDKHEDTIYEHIDVDNENEVGAGEDENVIIIPNIEDLHDYDESEVIVEEITLPDVIEEESSTYDDEGEAVVVIEDFEFFNKIEVRKDNSDTEILEFEEH